MACPNVPGKPLVGCLAMLKHRAMAAGQETTDPKNGRVGYQVRIQGSRCYEYRHIQRPKDG